MAQTGQAAALGLLSLREASSCLSAASPALPWRALCTSVGAQQAGPCISFDPNSSNQPCLPAHSLHHPGSRLPHPSAGITTSSTHCWASLTHVRGAKTKVIVEYKPLDEPLQDQYSTEPTNYLQLLGALRTADSTDRLKHLIQTYGGVFDAQHVSEALARLPRLAKYKNDDLVRSSITVPSETRLEQAAAAELMPRVARPGARPRPSYCKAAAPIALQLMAMIVGQANVKFINMSTLFRTGRISSDKKSHLWRLTAPAGLTASNPAGGQEGLGLQFKPRHTATCLWALGTLSSMGVHLDKELAKAVADMAVGRLEASRYQALAHAKPLEVAMTLKGLAQLKAWPRRKPILQELARYCREHAVRFEAHELQMAVRSLVRLGALDTFTLDALAARATVLCKDFTPRGISSLLQAFSQADASPAGRASHQAAMQALAAGIAPQITLLSGDDVAGLAAAFTRIGQPYVDTASSTATAPGVLDPAHLPAWVHSLVSMLADKAARDMQSLQPLQLASVLDMLAALHVPHVQLVQQVVDGVLVEHELDAGLPAQAGASLVRCLAQLNPYLGQAAASSPSDASGHSVLISYAKQTRVKQLEFRQTAEGLGNLPSNHSQDLISTAFGPLGTQQAGSSQGIVVPVGSRTRHDYQRLLQDGAPLNVKAAAAAERVMSVYTQPGALSQLDLSGVSELVSALHAARDWQFERDADLGVMLCERAEAYVQQLTQSIKDGRHRSAEDTAVVLARLTGLMAQLKQLNHPSAQLAASTTEYVDQLLLGGGEAAKQLLLPALSVMMQCRQHGAEPLAAAKSAGQVYASMVAEAGVASGGLPQHTASGLAPEAPRATWSKVQSHALGQLLHICSACNTLDSTVVGAAALQVVKLLEDPARLPASETAKEAAEQLPVTWLTQIGLAFAQYGKYKQGGLSTVEADALQRVIQGLSHYLQAAPAISQEEKAQVQALVQRVQQVGSGAQEASGLAAAVKAGLGMGSGSGGGSGGSPVDGRVLQGLTDALAKAQVKS